MATMGRERPKTLHNFTLPDLKWGVQRSLRCMKLQSNGGVDDRNRRLWRSAGEEGIEEFGEKMKESIFREQVVDYEEEEGKREREREASPPWNLRKRRAACKAPVAESGNCDEEAKFMSTLTKKEMEDDYMTMMGHRPPRRPKKRLRTLQKQIHVNSKSFFFFLVDSVFQILILFFLFQLQLLHPAFYFTQITEDIYQVPDAAETRKVSSSPDLILLASDQNYVC